MPYKPKNQNALRNGSPRGEKEQSLPDSSPLSSPIVTTNYREIHQNETEVLRSIYGDDFEDVESRRSAWHVGRKTPWFDHCLPDSIN